MPPNKETRCNRFDAMTPAEKFEISLELTATMRRVLAQLIRLELGDVNEARLKWEVALRIYGNDPATRRLLRRCEPEDDLKHNPPRRSVGLHTLGLAAPELIG